MSRVLRLAGGAITVILIVTACATPGDAETGPSVSVFGPYRGEEAARFADSMEPFEEQTGIEVRYVGTGSIAADLEDRIAEGNLPDVAFVPQPAVVGDLVSRNLVVPLSADVVAAIDANYALSAVDLMTFSGAPHGVLYRANLKSLIWYPPNEFAQRGYAPPETWEEMVALTERIESDGLEPWCLTLSSFAATGWVGTDWVEDLMVRLNGPEAYQAWIDGDIRFDDQMVRQAFELFGEIIHTPGRVHGGVPRILGVHWSDAASPMFADPPQCLLHRQASFYRSSLPPDVAIGEEVDVFVFPPFEGKGEPPLVIGGDLAIAFDDRPEVQALLAYLATPESGEAWAEAGGYNSPHATFNLDNYSDPFERRIGELLASAQTLVFDASDQMPPEVGTGTFWKGMVNYVQTGDLDSTLTLIQDGYGP